MSYVFNPDLKNEVVHGILREKLAFNKRGYAECPEGKVLNHFGSIPGYTILAELPENAGKVKPFESSEDAEDEYDDDSDDDAVTASVTDDDDSDDTSTPQTGTKPPKTPRAGSKKNVNSAGYTRAQLDAIDDQLQLFDIAAELGLTVENPRASKEELVDLIINA